MSTTIHGTKKVRGRQHPVLDLRHWSTEFPLAEDDRGEGGWIDCPGKLARREQALRRAKAKGKLGPSVPADVFVWAHSQLSEKPWFTRLGGTPWRRKGNPWPRDRNGVPLTFLGQICFLDSTDILPCELPGEVALVFGTARSGHVTLFEGCALEWSPLKINAPEDGRDIPWTGELPFAYQGVLLRTVQYTDWAAAEPVFKSLGYKSGGWGVHSIQATSISTYADLPQGWPFKKGDGNTLIATLSSYYFHGKWPLCDVPACLKKVYGDGRKTDISYDNCRDFGIGDAGCIWIYRDRKGKFRLGEACG